MPAILAKIFRNGRNQAVRIPVEFSMDTDTVTIERRDGVLIIRPVMDRGWDEFFANEEMVLPEDFDTGPDLPTQDREPL